MKKLKKVLILGSGPLKIGEAGEFDYSGSQAIKALKEEGIKTVLVNSNIASIQTSDFLADKVYFLPVDDHFVGKVIEKEKPDGIFLAFGGQTALNCGIKLWEKRILQKNKVEVLGSPIKSIILSEDRQEFASHLRKIGQPVPESSTACSIKEAEEIAKKIGFPLMVRASYTLGGQKSGRANNFHEFSKLVENTFAFSSKILVEKYLHHYKEVEYEVVRDRNDNCVTVCNMENMDPLGIHTGESIVVAPSQTLNNFEYHFLREVSIKIVRSLNIVGECNVQFALDPNPEKGDINYYVIEVNARLSRSSALASKATGYPLAYVAAKLALGKSLTEVKNQITQITQSCFEPALDYIAVKIPRWDLDKFARVEEKIGSGMKSVGEVMAIGRTFEESLQKAIRMLDIGANGVSDYVFSIDDNSLLDYIENPTPKRIFAIAEAIKRKIALGKISNLTGIDMWYLHRIKEIVDEEEKLLSNKTLDYSRLLTLKQLGFSDKRIGKLIDKTELEIRKLRKKLKIVPSIFQIDTLAGEIPAKTNYLYLTYNGFHNDVDPLKNSGTIVLGSGPYRIGSSVEFDWTCVNTALFLKNFNKKSIIVNCNPETVSTDYDISDRLYFEELTLERILDIYEFEKSSGVIISVGGQTPNNLAKALSSYGVNILGTTAENIDRAENRNKFSKLLDQLKISQPAWNKFTTIKEAMRFSDKVGYPVLVRPSYVLSGSAMSVCFNNDDLKTIIGKATIINKEFPVTISKFIENAKEIELDAIAEKGEIKVFAISEHIENAGVHSGDASIVYPAQKIYVVTQKKIIDIAQKIAKSLNITGPFNVQFIASENKVFVIEVNLRASRTFPFISKASGVNFSKVLVSALFHKSKKVLLDYPDNIAVKVPQFSFSRLDGADPVLRVEMSSTGEAASFGKTIEEAFLKAELSIGAKIPKKGIFISLGGQENKVKFADSIDKLKELTVDLYATDQTSKFLRKNGLKVKKLFKIHEKRSPNALEFFQKGKIDLAINIADSNFKKDLDDDYIIRRAAIDHNIHLLTNRQKTELFIKALAEQGKEV